MRTLSRLAAIGALALFTPAVATVTRAAPAAPRAPIRDCGDLGDASNGLPSAITAQGRVLTCTTARAIARGVVTRRSCRSSGNCVVRGFSCVVAKVGSELFLGRCEGSRQTRFVRFEFGS